MNPSNEYTHGGYGSQGRQLSLLGLLNGQDLNFSGISSNVKFCAAEPVLSRQLSKMRP